MGRRSPANERYQKYTSPEGKTRRSAASAKPKRDAASPGTKQAKPSSGKTKSGRSAYIHPTTPEYKRMRIIWWVFLGAAMVLSTASWLLWRVPVLRTYGNAVLIAAYASIAAAIYIDWAKMRPMRQQWIDSGKAAAGAEEKAKAAEKAKADKAAEKAERDSSAADKS